MSPLNEFPFLKALFILGMKVNLQEIYFAAQGRHLEIVSIVSIVL